MKKLLSYILLLTIVFSAVFGINHVFAATTPSSTSVLPSSDIAGKAEVLSEMGVLRGAANGDLRLDSALSRAEAATLVVRIAGFENIIPEKSDVFIDVPQTHWAANNINTAYSLGYVNGVSYNQFSPDRSVSANEFCTMLMRALVPNASISVGNAFRYYAGYSGAGLMAAKALTERVYFNRRDMVEMLYSVAIRSFVTVDLSPVLQNETYAGYESRITLPSNPSTGYSWSYSITGSEMLELIRESRTPTVPRLPGAPATGIIGAPANTTYSFKALKPGVAAVTFTLKSPSGEITETRKYDLIINDPDELKELKASDKVPLGESRVIRLNTNSHEGYVWSYWVFDTIDYQVSPTPTMSVIATGAVSPTPAPIITTHTPIPMQSVGGGYIANCVLMRELPDEDGKTVQEFIVKTYLYGSTRINFYYMAENSGITSMTNPLRSITVVVN